MVWLPSESSPQAALAALRSLTSLVSHFPVICLAGTLFAGETWLKSEQVCVEALDNLTAAVISLNIPEI